MLGQNLKGYKKGRKKPTWFMFQTPNVTFSWKLQVTPSSLTQTSFPYILERQNTVRRSMTQFFMQKPRKPIRWQTKVSILRAVSQRRMACAPSHRCQWKKDAAVPLATLVFGKRM